MNEAGYLLFSPTLFQYLDIKLSATASANLLSVVTIGYTLGRFLTGFVTQVVKTKFIIIGNLLLIFGSTIFIYIFQHDLLKLQIASFFIGMKQFFNFTFIQILSSFKAMAFQGPIPPYLFTPKKN